MIGAPAAMQPGHVLPVGTRLRDYEITGLIGEGGFGIVYLAWDHSLQRKVAVKEYMPAAMASRVGSSAAIQVKSDRHAETFRAGLKSFVNEARLLARFDHPSLVKVYRFWEDNGTAYMVMPFYEGPTLKASLTGLRRPPSEAELRAWLRPLLDALGVMHAAQCYHRDIAPDNILLTPTGPLLLDFGAARHVIGDMTHALTVVLKPGYAPVEQYGDVASMAQGAWTDLYALACVVYYAITGTTPMSSVERLMDDKLRPLAVAAAGRYSPAFLAAIDHALAVRPQDRPQSEREFRSELDGIALVRPSLPPVPAATPATVVPAQFPRTEDATPATVPRTLAPIPPTQAMARPAVAPPPAAPMPSAAPAAAVLARPRTAAEPPARGAAVSPSTKAKRWPIPAVMIAVVGLAGLTAAALWAVWPSPRTPLASSRPASAASTPSPSRAPPAVETAATVGSAPPLAIDAEATTVQSPSPVAVPVSQPAVPTPPADRPRRESRPESRPEPRPEPARRSDPPPPVKPAAAPRVNGARCSDILQKGSLEPLSADEAAYLKRECR